MGPSASVRRFRYGVAARHGVCPSGATRGGLVKELRHTLALGAMILMFASPAAAQFTTVVTPPKRAVVTATLVADPTPRDTGRRATLQEMSAWVDSVAGNAPSAAS